MGVRLWGSTVGASFLVLCLALSGCRVIIGSPGHQPPAPCEVSAEAPDLLTAPILGPSVDLTQGLSMPADGFWTVHLVEAGVGTRILVAMQWSRPLDPGEIEAGHEYGPMQLRGVELSTGSIEWTTDVSEYLPAPTPAGGWRVDGMSNARDGFALSFSDGRLPQPDSPAEPGVLMIVDAATGTVTTHVPDPGRPGGDNAHFLAYDGDLVAVWQGDTVWAAYDTDLTTPRWQHPSARFGDTTINGAILTADGYVDISTGQPTGLGADVSSTNEAVYYLARGESVFRMSNPAPDAGMLGRWEPGPAMLVDEHGEAQWDEGWIVAAQSMAVADGVAVMKFTTGLGGIGLDDGVSRWSHPIDMNNFSDTTIQGGGGHWAFISEPLPGQPDVYPQLAGVGLNVRDGTQTMNVALSSQHFTDPFIIGGCTLYTFEDGPTDNTSDDIWVARDMRTDDLNEIWSAPELDGILAHFDGVMVSYDILTSSIAQVLAS